MGICCNNDRGPIFVCCCCILFSVITLFAGISIFIFVFPLFHSPKSCDPTLLSNGTYYIAHRGVTDPTGGIDGAQENSEQAIAAAKANGFPMVEIDVLLTSDDHLVVFHDSTTERLTDDDPVKVIEELTLDEVLALSVKSEVDGITYPGPVNVTTLASVLTQYCDDPTFGVMIDVKESSIFPDGAYATELMKELGESNCVENNVPIYLAIPNPILSAQVDGIQKNTGTNYPVIVYFAASLPISQDFWIGNRFLSYFADANHVMFSESLYTTKQAKRYKDLGYCVGMFQQQANGQEDLTIDLSTTPYNSIDSATFESNYPDVDYFIVDTIELPENNA